MKGTVAIILLALSCVSIRMEAQDSDNVFNFLRLPSSAHVSALGGDNITLAENDASLVFHNPALINYVSDLTMNLNMMTYMDGQRIVHQSPWRACHMGRTGAFHQLWRDEGDHRDGRADRHFRRT